MQAFPPSLPCHIIFSTAAASQRACPRAAPGRAWRVEQPRAERCPRLWAGGCACSQGRPRAAGRCAAPRIARHSAALGALRSWALQPLALQLLCTAIALLLRPPLLHRRVEASGPAGIGAAPLLRGPGGQRSQRGSPHRSWPVRVLSEKVSYVQRRARVVRAQANAPGWPVPKVLRSKVS